MLSAGDEVRNLLGRYCDLIDRGDHAAVAGLFADDAVLAAEDGTVLARGRAAIAEHLGSLVVFHEGSPRTKHLVVNTVLEPDDGGSALTARSSYVVLQAVGDLPLQPIIAGRYVDRFEQATGAWRWTERRYAVDLVGDLGHHLAAFGDRLT